MGFSGKTTKILTFEYYAKNKTYSEVNFICVYQVWSKLIEKCPSKIEDGRHEFFFLVITTSDYGDFPRLIEIALLYIVLSTTVISLLTSPFNQKNLCLNLYLPMSSEC